MFNEEGKPHTLSIRNVPNHVFKKMAYVAVVGHLTYAEVISSAFLDYWHSLKTRAYDTGSTLEEVIRETYLGDRDDVS